MTDADWLRIHQSKNWLLKSNRAEITDLRYDTVRKKTERKRGLEAVLTFNPFLRIGLRPKLRVT